MTIPDVPIPYPVPLKKSYGNVNMKYVSSVFVANGTLLHLVEQSVFPKTFEDLGQENGFLMYETTIEKLFNDPSKLEILKLHDRAYIYVNKVPKGILSRSERVTSMPLTGT